MSFSLLEPWDHNRGSATLAKSVLLADAVTATLDSRDLGLLLDSVNTHAGRVGLLVPQTRSFPLASHLHFPSHAAPFATLARASSPPRAASLARAGRVAWLLSPAPPRD